MGSKPKPPPPPPPPPAPAPPPAPVARKPVQQAKKPSKIVSGASVMGSMARLAKNKKKPGATKVQGRSPLGGGSGMYGG
ncbi:hypothetical protein [uncultured Mediterranean phage uvMED]|nr:hypothetical protein [uncultured Mediterranean phage uvMED]BAR22526.1 PREDICTED: RNA-binding protein MEX3B-like [uncultured Mediterranean phage uvMED]